jgi:ArsR family transcriptional regulator
MLATIKALADPVRLRLTAILAHGEFTVQELTGLLAMGQSRVSRHLKILTEAGVLSVTRQGTWSYYRLGDDNPFFREIWPALEKQLPGLPGRRRDLDRLAEILDARRRRSREFFDRHARQWDQLAGEVLPTADYREALLDAVPPCRQLLEVGVGTGRLLADLRRKAAEVIGVDASPAMLDQARQRVAAAGLTGIDLRLGEMAHLPVPDGAVGGAVLNMVLHHAAQPLPVLAELARVLAPGGTLVIADLGRHEHEWARERMADQWLGFDPAEVRVWLAGSGFVPGSPQAISSRGEELDVFILAARRAADPTTTEEEF